MVRCMVLLSNNPAFFSCRHNGLEVLPVRDTAYAVIVAARDRIHLGWRMLNHPLYGNFRPYHQPFRSILLAAPTCSDTHASPACTQAVMPVDTESLNLVEQALAVYESCADRWATPENVPTEMFTDCSFIDCELMKATLDAYCPL